MNEKFYSNPIWQKCEMKGVSEEIPRNLFSVWQCQRNTRKIRLNWRKCGCCGNECDWRPKSLDLASRAIFWSFCVYYLDNFTKGYWSTSIKDPICSKAGAKQSSETSRICQLGFKSTYWRPAFLSQNHLQQRSTFLAQGICQQTKLPYIRSQNRF